MLTVTVPAPEPAVHDRINQILLEASWYAESTRGVKLHAKTLAMPDYHDFQYLYNNREVLFNNKDVQCDFLLFGHSMSHILSSFSEIVSEATKKFSSPEEFVVKGGFRMVGRIDTPLYATMLLSDMYRSKRVVELSNFVPAINELEIAMGLTKKLHEWVLIPKLWTASANEQQWRDLERFMMLTTQLWELLSCLSPVDIAAILKFFKSALPAAGLSLTGVKWYIRSVTNSLEHLLIHEQKEFANGSEVAAEFVVDVFCTEMKWHYPAFISTTRSNSVPPDDAAIDHIIQASMFYASMGKQMCGTGRAAAPNNFKKLSEPIKRGVRFVVEGKLEECAKKGQLNVLHLGLCSGIGYLAPLVAVLAVLRNDRNKSFEKIVARSASIAEFPIEPEHFTRLVTMVSAANFAIAVPAPDEGELPEELYFILLSVLMKEVLQIDFLTSGRLEEIKPPKTFALQVANSLRDQVMRSAAFAKQYFTSAIEFSKVIYEVLEKQIPGRSVSPIARNLLMLATTSFRSLFLLLSIASKRPDLTASDAKRCLDIASWLCPGHLLYMVVFPAKTPGEKRLETLIHGAMRELGRQMMESVATVPSLFAQYMHEFHAHACGKDSLLDKNVVFTNRLLVLAFGLSSIEVAKALDTSNLINKWTPAVIRCITTKTNVKLCRAGHDALIAPMLAKHKLTFLIVPTYVQLYAPPPPVRVKGRPPEERSYGFPHIDMVKTYAQYVRAVCQAVEQCGAASAAALGSDALKPVLLEAGISIASLSELKGLGVVLHIVQSTYENAKFFAEISSNRKEDIGRKRGYISALINMIQCSDPRVLSRVCAAIESVILVSLASRPAEQTFWVQYALKIVQVSINYSTKKGLLEWILRLEQRLIDSRKKMVSKL